MGNNKYNKKYTNNVANDSQEQLEEQVNDGEIQEGENLVDDQEQGVIETEGSEGQEVVGSEEGSEEDFDKIIAEEEAEAETRRLADEEEARRLATEEEEAKRLVDEAEAEAKRLAEEVEAGAKGLAEELELKKLSAVKLEDKVDTKGVVGDILKSSLSIKEKLKAISEVENALAYKSIVNKLLSYNEKMFNEQAVKPKDGAAANYDLFNLIKQVVSDTDFNSFKVKFSIINLMFLGYDKEAFSEQKLHRFDYEWKWGKESLTTYQHLITMIAMLANRSTREQHISKGILTRALNKDVISLNETAIQNIIKFYQS